MKWLLPAVCLLLAPQLLYADENEDSAREFIEAWVESFNKNNAEQIAAFYEQDERVEILASNGMALVGYEKIAESYRRDVKLVRFYDSTSKEMRIRVYGPTALVSFQHRFKYEVLNGGVRSQVHVRTTTALRHTDDGWKIAMEHSSAIRGVDRVTPVSE